MRPLREDWIRASVLKLERGESVELSLVRQHPRSVHPGAPPTGVRVVVQGHAIRGLTRPSARAVIPIEVFAVPCVNVLSATIDRVRQEMLGKARAKRGAR